MSSGGRTEGRFVDRDARVLAKGGRMEWAADFGFERTQAIVELARRGVLSDPDRPGNWMALSRALVNLGDLDAAVSCLRDGIEANPRSPILRWGLAQVLTSLGAWEEALSEAEEAFAMAPDDPAIRLTRLQLLVRLDARDAAEAIELSEFSSKNVYLMKARAQSLRRKDVVEWCDSILAENPRHTYARYVKAHALPLIGRVEEARQLIAVDRLVETQDLPVPSGYADGESFRDALAAEIRANPTLEPDPRGLTTRSGLQTRVLRRPEAVAIEALLGQCKEAVDAYVERMVASGDAFAHTQPDRVRLRPWAVVYGGGGRQDPHMHPLGWITGVYYVSAPRPAGANAYSGPLVLGAIKQRRGLETPPWGTREIEPVPGRLVLFPSHVPHATEPPGGEDGSRICVTFDVIDAAA